MTFYRFGFLVEYISQSTIVGFLAAAAVGIGLQQLKGLFGIDTNKTALFSVLKSLWTSFKNQVIIRYTLPLQIKQTIQFNYNSKFIFLLLQSLWHPYNFVIGFSFLCFILFTRFLVSIAATFILFYEN